jgi:hypothetical protein
MIERPELSYLRELMSDVWVDAEVFGDNPKHLLGQWWQKDSANVWIPHIESLVRTVLRSKQITADRKALAAKLKSEYVSTLAEMETAVFLEESGFLVVLEPFAPDKGADIRADFDKNAYYLEVRAVGDSEGDDRFNLVSKEMFSVLNGIGSRYSANITVGEEYAPRGSRLRDAMKTVRKSLEILEEKQWPRATLYYSPEGGSLLNPTGDFSGGSVGALGRSRQALLDSADFVVRFRNLGERSEKTPATAARPFKRVPQADQTHARLQKIMNKKREQLPKDSRGLVVIDCSDLFMLNDFSISAALYGDLMVRFDPVEPGKPVGDPIPYRNARGLFAKTSRVSAVLFHRRFVEAGIVQHDWQVYPTNRADPDTIRLTGAELARFGDLGDRANLTAEEAPNSLP